VLLEKKISKEIKEEIDEMLLAFVCMMRSYFVDGSHLLYRFLDTDPFSGCVGEAMVGWYGRCYSGTGVGSKTWLLTSSHRERDGLAHLLLRCTTRMHNQDAQPGCTTRVHNRRTKGRRLVKGSEYVSGPVLGYVGCLHSCGGLGCIACS
jgi:hypothetical protein